MSFSFFLLETIHEDFSCYGRSTISRESPTEGGAPPGLQGARSGRPGAWQVSAAAPPDWQGSEAWPGKEGGKRLPGDQQASGAGGSQGVVVPKGEVAEGVWL